MLFKTRFHHGIRDGSITLTVRAWKSARVRVGRRYRFGARDLLEVSSVEETTLDSIEPGDARLAGFASPAELRSELERGAGRRLDGRASVFRVAFHYAGLWEDPRAALATDLDETALGEVAGRLDRMDARSPRGAWTRAVLRLISTRPRTAASRLAPELGRDVQAFKADVRKLKKLGLTVSHEVGYELSPRGEAVLDRLGESDPRSG